MYLLKQKNLAVVRHEPVLMLKFNVLSLMFKSVLMYGYLQKIKGTFNYLKSDLSAVTLSCETKCK